MKNIGYRLKSMIKLFQLEPLWFKISIVILLLTTIVFSSSNFSHDSMYEGISKLAVAIFFAVYGYKMKMNRKVSMIFYALAGLCLVLAILAVSST